MVCFFFFNDTATTEIYTLSLHDALPIWRAISVCQFFQCGVRLLPFREHLRFVLAFACWNIPRHESDRKSTRLNSSHANISYAVFCLKKKISSRVRAYVTLMPKPQQSMSS